MIYEIFLFDKKHYNMEDIKSYEYGTAFMLYNEDSENVKFFKFDSEEHKDKFISLKIIQNNYHTLIF